MVHEPQFLFVTCQDGAESAVKHELARKWPGFRLAYSRPGFLTFKIPADRQLSAGFDPGLVFARSHGVSLGKVTGTDSLAMAEAVWKLYGEGSCQQIHIWARKTDSPDNGIEQTGADQMLQAAQESVLATCPFPDRPGLDGPAQPGDMVLDCILVDPDLWWVGHHCARRGPSQWPGGMIRLEMPPGTVSRAWLKMEEALRWANLPIPPTARFAELGSAPGGASQALLARGWQVIGVDPAEMAAAVVEHPRFRHIRRRAVQVRRCEFRKIRWLTADMNVAPSYTLSVVEDIVQHPEVNVRGMLLTLKLPQWELADHVSEYLDRVRGWGFNRTAARQLQHNRQEICVAALKQPFYKKGPRRR